MTTITTGESDGFSHILEMFNNSSIDIEVELTNDIETESINNIEIVENTINITSNINTNNIEEAVIIENEPVIEYDDTVELILKDVPYNIPKAVSIFLNTLNELNISNDLISIINTSSSLAFIYIILFFKNIIITNQNNESHNLKYVFVKLCIKISNTEFTITNMDIYRSVVTYKEYNKSYVHSHANTGKFIWRSVCLGNNGIYNVYNFNKSINYFNTTELGIKTSFLGLMDAINTWLCTESNITGSPYISINDLNTLIDLPNVDIHKKNILDYLKMPYVINSIKDKIVAEIVIQLISIIILNCTIYNKQIILKISKEEINNKLSLLFDSELLEYKGDAIINNILILTDDKLQYITNINIDNNITTMGKAPFTFKGKDIDNFIILDKDIDLSKFKYSINPNIMDDLLIIAYVFLYE